MLRLAPSREALTEPPQRAEGGRREPRLRGRGGRTPLHPTPSKCGGGAERVAGFSLLTQEPCHPRDGAPPPSPDAPRCHGNQQRAPGSALIPLGDRALPSPLPSPEAPGSGAGTKPGAERGGLRSPGGETALGARERQREELGATLGRERRAHAESRTHTAPHTSVTPVLAGPQHE